ncbi:hypothetical protein ACFFMN_31545 [Planobispora siamensis]|uniref:Secreted protein n=1 Tax=Planobispora siamensis TaxID=936338 RepID=A0A8J3WJD4_9ACTN|nr:hypothetical protein [Planobispora siamensis]GIH92824.1 hypothetical protein Psi01_34540 [Planobispora siamensis]
MRTWRKLSKLAAVTTLAGGLAFTGTPAAVADGGSTEKSAALACGGNVFLDGIRALAISENGRDEVYIEADGVKIWPAGGSYVSMTAGQRVEVDKCVRPQAALRLMEVDDLDPNDVIGRVILQGDVTRDYEFCCGDGGRYRIGAVR